jgi:hypothetical protein
MTNPLQDYIAKTSREVVHPVVAAMADIIRAKHANVHIVLAYGSALRDSDPENTLIDYYVLTESFDGVSTHAVSRWLCKLVPPNVYYAEMRQGEAMYRAKYAVLPMEQLAAKVSAKTTNPYFWARLCQPVRIVWAADAVSERRIIQIIEKAMRTARWHARQLASTSTHAEQWIELFRHTYPTELRPENASRAALIVESQLEHFETVARLAGAVDVAQMPWSWRNTLGKCLSVLRLIKAAFTFQGGADYAAWKIKRHSGIEIELKNWHRKHPILASIVLLPKLLRSGALK